MVMKKYLVSIASLAAMIGLVACQKTEIKPSPIAEGSTFTLAADIEQTKTTLNGLEVNWEEGDILYLVTTNNGPWGKPFTEDEKGATIAEYTYADGEFTSEATIADGSYTFNALYDGSKSQKSYHRGASTTYSLQSTQTQDCKNPTAHLKNNDALVGSFTASVPRTNPASVNMSHIFAIMRVDVKNATGAEVELKSFEMSAAGANLAGVYTVNFANAPIDITENKYLSNSITVKLTNGTVANGSSLPVYFVMAPLANYSGDVTFTVTDADDKVYTKTVALSNVTFRAGSLNTTPYKITTGVASTCYTWDLSVNSTTEATTEKLAWTNDVADMVCAKGKSTTAANNYYPGASGRTSTRFYSKSTLSITPKTEKSLTYYVFEATTTGYATALANSTWTNAVVLVDDKIVTVIAKDPNTAVSAVIGDTCGFTKVECHTDPAPTVPPVINASPMSFSIKAAGDVCTINYSIDFPVDGKSISATSNQDWVNTFDYKTAGEVSFVVDENTGDTRSATIILSYEGAEPVNITVAQDGTSSANSKTVVFIAGTDTSNGTSLSKEDVTITITGGTLSRDDNYRVYANKEMTISVPTGNTITRIETVEVSGNANLTADGFTKNGLNGTWIGASESVKFSCTKQSRITKITVTYE